LKILALDLGTQTGWALYDTDFGRIGHGIFNLKPTRFEGPGMRAIKLRTALTTLAKSEPPQLVAYEEVHRHAGTAAAHVYGGLLMTLQAWCEPRMIPFTGIPVGTVKKRATGKGNAKKQAMIDAAKQHFSIERGDKGDLTDDEADALWVAICAAETYGPERISTGE
jgi:Holliday junction resolvasome RuvABC endonuclease subunit